jgi:hypothetical protein
MTAGRSTTGKSFWIVFAATFLASTGSVFVITLLALHVYRLSSAQTLAALVPITQWVAAVPCVFVVRRMHSRLSPSRLMGLMFCTMAVTSLVLYTATALIAPLMALLLARGAADFVAKNARAQWLKDVMNGAANPQRCGSLIATSQYLGTFAGGLFAYWAGGRCTIGQALVIDVVFCSCAALLALGATHQRAGVPVVVRANGTGWAELFKLLHANGKLATLFVALVGFAGLFQGFHQAAKIGLVTALHPLAAADIPGILQAIAGLGIVLGAIAGGFQGLYRSLKPLAACAFGASSAVLVVGAGAGHALGPVLVAYFAMMLLFEIGFTISNNQLLMVAPQAHIPAMHSASYVLSCISMAITSFFSAAAFEAFGLARGAALVIAISALGYWLLRWSIGRWGVRYVSSDVC